MVQASREERDRKVEKLRVKYAPKKSALEDQIRRARDRLEREQAQANRSTWDATVALGSSVLGALLGRKPLSKTNVSKAASAARAAGRAAQEHGDVDSAGASLAVLQRKFAALEAKFRGEVNKLDAALRPEALRWNACRSGPGRRTSPSSRSSWPGRRGRPGPRAGRSQLIALEVAKPAFSEGCFRGEYRGTPVTAPNGVWKPARQEWLTQQRLGRRH